MFPSIVAKQHWCIILLKAVYVFRERLVSGEMHSVAEETFPCGLSQNELQTLLGANFCALLEATIGHHTLGIFDAFLTTPAVFGHARKDL